eukprot:CAMPEP_0170342512 /NCGR_PEP_ID=MMETSP0116_2-20130129/72414_1 /TAXON_ID=400756 /ORGANISM="Durinskia baltica, Strain CSIRO CS-38" /LENGTH=115 /DNA_ID=CAMNT_0010596131 /DNA_START=14 /DNA_END=357 /DNA_ORIENTATION=+
MASAASSVSAIPEVARDVIAGGVSTAAVSALLNPIDVLKTRRQIARSSRTALEEARLALQADGPWRGLWRPGLTASIARELLYSGCTKGFYPAARDAVAPADGPPTLAHRALAAA